MVAVERPWQIVHMTLPTELIPVDWNFGESN